MDKQMLTRQLKQISDAQDKYKFELVVMTEEFADVELWQKGEYVKTIPLFLGEMETLDELVDRLFFQTDAHRNFKYELKKKLAGLEKVTFWTNEEQADVLREIADALLRYPELTVGMLRCIKTGHNVSLARVDEKMKERYKEGYYS